MSRCINIIQSDPEVPAGVFANLLAERQVPFRLVRPDLGEAFPTSAAAVIILGGRMGVHDAAKHPFLLHVKAGLQRLLVTRTPLFGICLGGQLLSAIAGGTVSSNRCGEKGLVEITLTGAGRADPLFAEIGGRFQAFQWHNDSFTVPPGALHLAQSQACPGQAFRLGNAWGVQFHPEVDRTIVAAWSEHAPEPKRLRDAFAVAAAEHQELARKLLKNFLQIAGWRGP